MGVVVSMLNTLRFDGGIIFHKQVDKSLAKPSLVRGFKIKILSFWAQKGLPDITLVQINCQILKRQKCKHSLIILAQIFNE